MNGDRQALARAAGYARLSDAWTAFNGGNPSQAGATPAKLRAFDRWLREQAR